MGDFKTLQIGNVDTVGSRFNGQELSRELNRKGFQSNHLVWKKLGKQDDTIELDYPFKTQLNSAISTIEHMLSLQSILHPAPLAIAQNRLYKDADLVHYHLLHTGWFSLHGLPALTKEKPSVITLHDPWMLTGHCIHPRSCDRWQTGCGSCPDLESTVSMKRDNTDMMWQIKKDVFSKSKFDVVVASKWMLEMVKNSPIFSQFDHHLIPFGIDLEKFRPGNSEYARKKLGIYPGNIVLCLRATPNAFKGLKYVLEALEKLSTTASLTILTLEDKQLFKDYLGKHQLIDLGWIDDPAKIAEAYQAADIFLMPSMAEAFGVMAIEAMACAKPVIVFDGTALPDIVFAPEGGISVPLGDSTALARAMTLLIESEDLRKKIGMRARELAEQHYGWDAHVSNISELYRTILKRKTKSASEFLP